MPFNPWNAERLRAALAGVGEAFEATQNGSAGTAS